MEKTKWRKAVAALIKVGMQFDKAMEDQHITRSEWIKIGWHKLQFFFAMRHFKEIVTEFKAMSAEQKAAEVEYFKNTLKLRNPDLEHTIEDIFELGLLLSGKVSQLN